MSGDIIKVMPGQLDSTSHVAKSQSIIASNLSQDIGNAFTDLTGAMATVDILSGVASELETFCTGLMARLACFATGLTVIDGALTLAAEAFTYLDRNLATTFLNLENQLSYYTGYETNVAMPHITIPAGFAAGNYTLSTTTLTLQTASQQGGLLGSLVNAWHDTTSAASSAWHSTTGFISQHGTQVLKDTGIGLAIGGIWVAGVFLTPETGGASDAGAAAGTAALLSAAG